MRWMLVVLLLASPVLGQSFNGGGFDSDPLLGLILPNNPTSYPFESGWSVLNSGQSFQGYYQVDLVRGSDGSFLGGFWEMGWWPNGGTYRYVTVSVVPGAIMSVVFGGDGGSGVCYSRWEATNRNMVGYVDAGCTTSAGVPVPGLCRFGTWSAGGGSSTQPSTQASTQVATSMQASDIAHAGTMLYNMAATTQNQPVQVPGLLAMRTMFQGSGNPTKNQVETILGGWLASSKGDFGTSYLLGENTRDIATHMLGGTGLAGGSVYEVAVTQVVGAVELFEKLRNNSVFLILRTLLTIMVGYRAFSKSVELVFWGLQSGPFPFTLRALFPRRPGLVTASTPPAPIQVSSVVVDGVPRLPPPAPAMVDGPIDADWKQIGAVPEMPRLPGHGDRFIL